MLHDDHLLQAMHSAGVSGRNVVYLSAPITSGAREIDLMVELGVRRAQAARDAEPERWRHTVRCPNEADAFAQAVALRRVPWVQKGFVVVDPSRISIEGWEQDDYNRFWVRLMREHVRYLVPGTGWEYSRGARSEVGFALTFPPADLTLVDNDRNALDRESIRARAENARRALRERGWSDDEVTAYLPALSEAEPELEPSAQSQAFAWLVRERRFQVRRFGSARDDENLISDGLRDGGWWSVQLGEYLRRAQAHELSDDRARLDLAKFVATGVAALESSIRVFGPVPVPGTKDADL
jgi:hypothetical protein